MRSSLLIAVVLLASCAQTAYEEPIVYRRNIASPSQDQYSYNRGPYDQNYYHRDPYDERRDIADCQAIADEYERNPDSYWNTAKSGLVGGAVGAGTGAIAGTIMRGNVGRSTGAGAAVGGIAGILYDLARRDGGNAPSRRRVVERCLESRGYTVQGWR